VAALAGAAPVAAPVVAPAPAPAGGGGGLGALAAALAGGAAPAAAPPPGAPAALADLRVLGALTDAQGQRFREFRSATLASVETAFPDWPVRGPRTTLWVMNFVVRHFGTPLSWHMRWASATRRSDTDEDVKQHEFLCRLLETGACYDQLNLSNSAMCELVCRQLQLLEEKVHECQLTALSSKGGDKKAASHGMQAAESAAEGALFLGTSEGKANLCISPALAAWVAEQLRAESQVSKERRKAREERASRG
jgi:hypothetical protein